MRAARFPRLPERARREQPRAETDREHGDDGTAAQAKTGRLAALFRSTMSAAQVSP